MPNELASFAAKKVSARQHFPSGDAMNVSFFTDNARATTLPPLSNEILGLIIESLGEDVPSLRSCSLVSSVFRHFCNPILYRDIELDRKDKLETFFQLGERSDFLVHTRSLSLTYSGFDNKTHLRKPRKILDTISQKASLESLRLHNVQFQSEPFTASLLSNLSTTVTALALQYCCFGGFEDFVSFIRCFPRCQVLRLRYCIWTQDLPNLRFKDLPTYDLAPVHLDISNTSQGRWGRRLFDQGKIVGMPWLNLTGLKSFTYVIQADPVPGPVVGHIATCELLEAVDVSAAFLVEHNYAIPQLALLITRVKSLTLRCHSGLLPWKFTSSPDPQFPSSLTLERIRIITPGPFPMIEGCRVLDNTFSDTDRYPSLVEFEVVRSFRVSDIERNADLRCERVHMDEYLPRLKASGKLPSNDTRKVESVRPVDTFDLVAGAYYKDSM